MRTSFVLLVCALLPLAAGAQEEFWCWDADEVEAKVDGGSVRIFHLAALINCCPEPITYDVEVGDATILVVEHSMDICDCQCCFNLEMTLEDVPPGTWNLVYRWLDWEIWDWTERVLEIVVPDVGQALEPVVTDQGVYGCLETSGVPEPPDPRRMTWGRLKARYH
jgi:hypothetical protein